MKETLAIQKVRSRGLLLHLQVSPSYDARILQNEQCIVLYPILHFLCVGFVSLTCLLCVLAVSMLYLGVIVSKARNCLEHSYASNAIQEKIYYHSETQWNLIISYQEGFTVGILRNSSNSVIWSTVVHDSDAAHIIISAAAWSPLFLP